MSTVLDKLAAAAAPTVEAQATSWTDKLADALDARVGSAPPAVQGALAAAIKSLRANDALVGQTTAAGFTALVSHLALGAEDPARAVWLSTASFDADMEALDDAFAATRADAAEKERTWATVRSVALQVLEAAGKAAVPILLSLAGL